MTNQPATEPATLVSGECWLCKQIVTADDVAPFPLRRHVICLRCYAREVGDEHPLPADLRADVQRVADGA